MADPSLAMTPTTTVRLSVLIHKLVHNTHNNFKQLAQSLESKSDNERKTSMIDFLQATRNQFVKLLVIVKWTKNVQSLVQQCWEILNLLERQDSYFRGTADGLYHLHNKLHSAKAPIYDVPTAIDILTTGRYRRLPNVIEGPIPPSPCSTDEVDRALQRLNAMMHLRLFSSTIPRHFTSIKINDGRAYCNVKDEFEIVLTVDGDRATDYWKVLSLNIFIAADEDAMLAETPSITPKQLFYLKDLVQRRSFHSDQPFVEIYQILHTFCTSLELFVLYSQAQALSKSRTNSLGALTVDYVNEKKLSISYWPQIPNSGEPMKASMNTDSTLELALDPEKPHLSVNHSPPIISPEGSQPQQSNFEVNPSRLNLEQLLLKVMRSHAHMKLHRIYKHLQEEPQFSASITLSDPALLTEESSGLKVTLLDTCFLLVTVDLKSGRFLLKLEAKTEYLSALEDRLNKDIKEIGRIAFLLRHKKILDYYEHFGYSLGLEPFRRLTLKLPRPTSSQSVLYLRFPDPLNNFYLFIELDEQSFQTKFFLLQTRKNQYFVHTMEQIQQPPVVNLNGFAKDRELSQKRRKIASAKEDIKNDAVSGILDSSVLLSIISSCRKKIGKMVFSQQLDERKIKHKNLNDNSLTFVVPCKPLAIKEMSFNLGDNMWEVKLLEADEKAKIRPLETDFRDVQPGGRVRYSLSQHCYVMTYEGSPVDTSLEVFLRDLQSVAALYDLKEQYERDNALKKAFRLEAATLSQLIFTLDLPTSQSKIIVTPAWSNVALFAVNYKQHPLAHFFESLLNHTRSLKQFLECILKSNKSMEQILMLPSLHNSDFKGFAIIPRSSSQVRLAFKIFGVDIRFVTEESVVLEDAALSLVFGVPPRFFPIVHLQKAVAELASRTGSASNITNGVLPGHTVLAYSQLPDVLPPLLHYLGVLFVLRTAQLSVALIEKRDPKEPDIQFAFTLGKTEYVLSIANYATLELKARGDGSSGVKLLSDANLGESLPPDELAVLCAYFNEKIARVPYAKEHVATFVSIMNLPIPALKELVHLMTLERTQQKFAVQFALCLHTIEIARPSSRITVQMKVYRNDNPDAFINFGLTYNWDSTAVTKVDSSSFPEDNKIVRNTIRGASGLVAGVQSLLDQADPPLPINGANAII